MRKDGVTAANAGAVLTVDLGAIVANWKKLAADAKGAEIAGVVKADAYGLGATHVAPALLAAGCRTFFVAHEAEGLELRPLLPGARIFVLHGPNPGTEAGFTRAGLIPVLNTLPQVRAWARHAAKAGKPAPCALHVDTGMTRLGLSRADFEEFLADPGLRKALDLVLVMSHFACADRPDDPMSGRQIAAFSAFRAALPGVPAALSASSGYFLGAPARFDLVRPGIALYGGNPTNAPDNPMAPVVTLAARILHIQPIDAPQTVGYGATYAVPGPGRLATVGVGYADGFLRGIGEAPRRGIPVFGGANGVKVPMAGRISMDLSTYDVSALPEGAIKPGDSIEMIGKYATIDQLATAAGTISYELLTRLGRRFHRVYRNGGTP